MRPQGIADDVGAFETKNEPTGAAGLVVDTIYDRVAGEGRISLREAISNANANGGGTISFAPSVFNGKQIINLNGTALPDINVALAIVAPSGGLIISGENKSRIFKVNSAGNLTLQRLTLSEGNAGAVGSDSVSGRGGAVFNEGELTLLNCTLNNNNAARGGALY